MSTYAQSELASAVSLNDVITDLQALYGTHYTPTTVDDPHVDFHALYASVDLPVSLDDFHADMRALYGNLPIEGAPIFADFEEMCAV